MHAGDLPPLAHRFERRKQPTLLQHGTIDSWDFPTTLFLPSPSPTQSVFHRSRRTSLDGRRSIDERDEKEDERTGGDALSQDGNGLRLSLGTGQEQAPDVAARSAESPPIMRALVESFPTKPSSDAPSATGSGSESLFSNMPSSDVSPTVASTPTSPPSLSEPVLPPPNRSLWRRIRKSGYGKEAAESRSTFINSILQRGKG